MPVAAAAIRRGSNMADKLGARTATRRTQRVFVMRPPGPLGFAVLMLVLALIVAAIFVTIIGAFLIWIPVVALFVAVAAVYRFLRR